MLIIMGTTSDSDEGQSRDWVPRNILRRTNWLYHVDVLRPHDRREIDIL